MSQRDLEFWISVFMAADDVTLTQDGVNAILDHFGMFPWN